MSENEVVGSVTSKNKNRKVNRMTPDQAKAKLAKLESVGDKSSRYYMQVKAIAEAN